MLNLMFVHAKSPRIIILTNSAKSGILLKVNMESEVMKACNNFVQTVKTNMPDILKRKPKLHILLHLASDMRNFGATACFNTERLQHRKVS